MQKLNSQCIIDLIVKGKTIKFIGENIFNVGVHKDFLDGTPKYNWKGKYLKKWTLSKWKTFALADITVKIKKQAINWEKIFATQTSDKGLVSRIHKRLIQLNNKIQPKCSSTGNWINQMWYIQRMECQKNNTPWIFLHFWAVCLPEQRKLAHHRISPVPQTHLLLTLQGY